MSKAKTGPKPKDVPRTPSGQPSRSNAAKKETAEDILAIGIAARERVYGVSKAMARSQMAGYPIGRLCLAARWDASGKASLTPAQHDALLAFSRLRTRYLHAIVAAKQIASPSSAEMVSSESFAWTLDIEDEDRAKANAAIRNRYADARSCIVNLGEGSLATVVRIASDEQEARPSDIATLIAAANLLIGLWSARHRRAA